MGIAEILASIDREIVQLKQVRGLLSGAARQQNRRNGLVNGAAGKSVIRARAKKRVLSPEGRKRIADAQKKRWAAQRKTTAAAQK
jgi:hypothetical protein